jgi:ABC-2 type transport system ATP-binding protein
VFDLEEVINNLPDVDNYELKIENPKKISVTIKKGQGLNEIFALLSNLGIKISSMRNETGRLEELFLGLVEPTIKEDIHGPH